MADRRPVLRQATLIGVENGKRYENTAGLIRHEEHIRDEAVVEFHMVG